MRDDGLSRSTHWFASLNERVQTHIEGTQHTLLSWLKEEASNAAQTVLQETAQSLSVALSILVNLLNPHKNCTVGSDSQQVPKF